MKTKKYIAALCAASMLAACSDWNDHYDVSPADAGRATSTLWQTIQANPELSQFADLAEKAGYADLLSSSQTLTVWAPVNNSFNLDAMQGWSKDRLAKEFLQNHVARNNYAASGAFNVNVKLLNNKMKHFIGDNGTYLMGDLSVLQANQPCLNGVIHTLDGQLAFLTNVFESLNNEVFPIDSISNYLHSHDIKELDVDKSTQGPVVDGEITYLDSVLIESNNLFDSYGSYINREDSSYTMIVPTNEAWVKAKKKVESYFNYIPEFTFRENTSSDDAKYQDVRVNIDADVMRDSLIHKSLLADLYYNNNLYENYILQFYNDISGFLTNRDSLCSTGYSTIYGEDINRLLEKSQYVEKSNGGIFVVDSLRMRPWTSWCPALQIEADDSYYSGSVLRGIGVRTPVTKYNPAVPGVLSKNNYVEIVPESSVTNPEISFYLKNIRSATYAVYVVVVPENIGNEAIEEVKPNRMRAYIGYNDETGRLREKRIGATAFENDPTRVDTIYIDDFTFPVSYAELETYAPYLRLEGYVTSSYSATHDRTMRIDKVMLIPKEMDDYIKENPGYKPGLDPHNSYVNRR